MKISPLQLQEIDFLIKHFAKSTPSEEDKIEYIKHTVYGDRSGKGRAVGNSDNPLLNAKRSFDIMVKQYTVDIRNGIIGYSELKEDFNHPYFDKVLHGIMSGIDYTKRKKNDGFALMAIESARCHFVDYPTDENRDVVSRLCNDTEDEWKHELQNLK